MGDLFYLLIAAVGTVCNAMMLSYIIVKLNPPKVRRRRAKPPEPA